MEDNLITVVINSNFEEKEISIPVWEIGVRDGEEMERLILTTETGYNIGQTSYVVDRKMLKVSLPPISAAVYRKKI